MLVALSFLFGLFTGGVFLPLTISTFAYALAERKHRPAWAGLPVAAVRVASGPYRTTEVVPAGLRRAPLLVRLAAVSAFYWAWLSAIVWVAVAGSMSGLPPRDFFVVGGLIVSLAIGRAGLKLLRRDADAVTAAQRAAALACAHAAVLAVTALLLAGEDLDGVAALFAVLACAQAGLLAVAGRRHAALFAWGRGDATPAAPLPRWLARVLGRRAQRRANFFTSASRTMPGA